MQNIPVILGETASGKTSVGIELAKLLDGEVISVDSRKVYHGLPVGTATPEGEWKAAAYVVQGVPHHLMGQLAPDHAYTAGDFAKDADLLIQQISQRGKIPILVGGTGFYFKALSQGLPILPTRDEALRALLMARVEKEGIDKIYAELRQKDPQAAAAITPHDKHKIIRALEIFELTGRPFSDWKDKKSPPAEHSFAVTGVRFSKDVVEKRIEERSEHMFKEGMIEETEAVLKAGYAPTCPALASFGYREAVEVIQGIRPKAEFLPALIKGTKAYAKRQRTWFRTQVRPLWFDCTDTTPAHEIAMKMRAFLENSRK